MATKTDLYTSIELELKDNAEFLNTLDYDECLKNALHQYSKDRPRIRTYDYIGDGESYEWNVPTDWVKGLSRALAVEYPADQQLPNYLPEERWEVYVVNEQPKLRLKYDVPASGEVVRLHYSVLHEPESVPEPDLGPLVKLAVAYCFRMLAARFAQTSESLVGADSAEHRDRTDTYLRLAEAYEREYCRAVGRTEESNPAATIQADWDIRASFGRFLFHRALRR